MECEHKNKAYSQGGMTLTCNPPINISYWICKDCGFEGKDSRQDTYNNEYEETRQKFKK